MFGKRSGKQLLALAEAALAKEAAAQYVEEDRLNSLANQLFAAAGRAGQDAGVAALEANHLHALAVQVGALLDPNE